MDFLEGEEERGVRWDLGRAGEVMGLGRIGVGR